MKFLLGATLVLILIYIVAGSAITSVISVGEGSVETAAGGKLTRSAFRVTFRDQFLCYSYTDSVWVMRGRNTGEDCSGPFIDSATLCHAMAEVDVTQIRLHWEGRMLECDAPTPGDF